MLVANGDDPILLFARYTSEWSVRFELSPAAPAPSYPSNFTSWITGISLQLSHNEYNRNAWFPNKTTTPSRTKKNTK
jgi:hypothetical protein